MITENSFPVTYINPNVNQERDERREMAMHEDSSGLCHHSQQ